MIFLISRRRFCAYALMVFISLTAFCENPVLVIGAEDSADPWSRVDGSGYVNDLVVKALEKVGVQVELDVVPYARGKHYTIQGKYVGCFSASRTADLEVDLIYPEQPVFWARNKLFVSMDSTLSGSTPDDWGSVITVGLVNGYEYRQEVMDMIENGNIRVEYAKSEELNLRKLAHGRIDGAIINLDEVKTIEYVTANAGIPNSFKEIADYGGEPAFVVFSRRHPDGRFAADAFDKGYDLMEQQGEIDSLKQYWQSRILGELDL